MLPITDMTALLLNFFSFFGSDTVYMHSIRERGSYLLMDWLTVMNVMMISDMQRT